MLRTTTSWMVAVTLSVAGLACDKDQKVDRPAPAKQTTSPTTTPSLTDRLLGNLAERQQWRMNQVKLGDSTIAVKLTHAKREVEVRVWPWGQNDCNTPLMRINRGEILYAITNAEYEELRRLSPVRGQ